MKSPETKFGAEEIQPSPKTEKRTNPKQDDNLRTKFKQFMDGIKTTTAKVVGTVSVTAVVAASAIILPGIVDVAPRPEYTATVDLDAVNDAVVVWGEEKNTIILDDLFSIGEDENCAYRISLVDEAGEVITTLIDTDSSPEFVLDKSVDYAKILIEEVYLREDEVIVFRSFESDAYYLSAPKITFLDGKILESHGYYLIPYVIESRVGDQEIYNRLEFVASTDGEVISVDKILVNRESYIGIYMDSFTEEFTISATASLNGAYGGYEREISSERAYTNSPELHTVSAYYKYADPWYDDSDTLVFDFKYSAPSGSYLVMVNNDTGEEVALGEDEVYHTVSVEAGIYDVYYKLVSTEGETLCQTDNFIFDSSVTSTYDVFNYQNPSSVTVTYNQDGTINIYIPTDFASSDPNVYYEVVLDDKAYRFTGPLARIENIPNKSYSLAYRVCVDDENGMKYALMSVTVSGTIDDMGLPIEVAPNDRGAYISLSYQYELLGDSLLISINNEAPIAVDKASLVYDENMYVYGYTVEYTGEITHILLEFESAYNDSYHMLVEQYGTDVIKGEWLTGHRVEYIVENTEGE